MATYYGFSTVGRQKKFAVTDFDLAKQDLINNLNIRKGEKLMLPNFGTIIWGLLFEPLTPEIKAAIMNDISTIIAYDPRIATDKITISEFNYGIQILLELRYVPTNQTETLELKFDKNLLT